MPVKELNEKRVEKLIFFLGRCFEILRIFEEFLLEGGGGN